MFRTFVFLLITITSSMAWAEIPVLDTDFFKNHESLQQVDVLKSQRVFIDEQTLMDLYKVTYKIKTESQNQCQYIWVDWVVSAKGEPFVEMTDIDCSEDIESLTKPLLIDEY